MKDKQTMNVGGNVQQRYSKRSADSKSEKCCNRCTKDTVKGALKLGKKGTTETMIFWVCKDCYDEIKGLYMEDKFLSSFVSVATLARAEREMFKGKFPGQ